MAKSVALADSDPSKVGMLLELDLLLKFDMLNADTEAARQKQSSAVAVVVLASLTQ